jgi:Cu+-exporting ATPase
VTAGKPGWVASASGAAVGESAALGGLAARREQMEAAAQTVIAARLRQRGIEPVMLTGDNASTAAAVAASAGLAGYRAGLLPGGKAAVIRELQAEGHRVVMVGDGINDAPALAQADIGIAMGGGTDIAIESADIVLTGSRLTAVADARDIGVASFRKTRQNLAVALSFNGIGVPLAVTSLLAPVWAMIAAIASASVVLANFFGTRLRPRSFLLLARGLRQAVRELVTMRFPQRLARTAWRAETAGYLALVAAAVSAGYGWH